MSFCFKNSLSGLLNVISEESLYKIAFAILYSAASPLESNMINIRKQEAIVNEVFYFPLSLLARNSNILGPVSTILLHPLSNSVIASPV